MECVLCSKTMTEYRDYYKCKSDNVVIWKNHTKEGRPANLHRRIPLTKTEEVTMHLMDVLRWLFQPYHIIFAALGFTGALFIILIGMTWTVGFY